MYFRPRRNLNAGAGRCNEAAEGMEIRLPRLHSRFSASSARGRAVFGNYKSEINLPKPHSPILKSWTCFVSLIRSTTMSLLGVPSEIIALVLDSCDSVHDALALVSTCKHLYREWIEHGPKVVWSIWKEKMIAVDEALIAVSRCRERTLDERRWRSVTTFSSNQSHAGSGHADCNGPRSSK